MRLATKLKWRVAIMAGNVAFSTLPRLTILAERLTARLEPKEDADEAEVDAMLARYSK